MPGIRRMIGVGLDGSNVAVTLGKIEVPLISISYGDKLEPAKLSAMGGQQIDEITQGTYDTDEVAIKVSAVNYRALIMPAMPIFGGGNVRMPITVSFSHPDLGDDSDLLDGCRLIGWPLSLDNTNAAQTLDLKAITRQIFWTSDRKTINLLRGIAPPGATGF